MFGFNYKTYLFLFLSGVVGSLLLTPFVRRLALRLQVLDDPSVRRTQERPMPTLGGLSVFVTFVLLVGLCMLFENQITVKFSESGRLVAGILVCGGITLLLGIYDDARGADAKKKFSVQILAAVLAFALGFRIEGVSLGPFGSVNLGGFSLPFTILWIVGITNALNMIDGMDGLAAGVAFFVCAANFFVSLVLGNVVMSVISVILAGALLGFLRYNFPPAKIFLGDTGSLFLGMVIALSSIASAQKGSTVVMMLIPIAALGLPILDTSLAVFRRSLLGRPVFASDKGHIHHALLKLGLSRRQVLLILYAFCVVLIGSGVLVLFHKNREATIYLGAIGLISIIGLRNLGYLNYGKIHKALSDRWRYRAKNIFCRLSLLKMRNVDSVNHLWKILAEAAEEFDVNELYLSLNGGDDEKVLHWVKKKNCQEKNETPQDERNAVRLDFSNGLGCLSLQYVQSDDEDFEIERNYRLEQIGVAAERKLNELLQGSGGQSPKARD